MEMVHGSLFEIKKFTDFYSLSPKYHFYVLIFSSIENYLIFDFRLIHLHQIC